MTCCSHQCLTLNHERPFLPHLQLKSSFNLLKRITVKFTGRSLLNARHTYHTCITCHPFNLIFIAFFHSNWLVIRNNPEKKQRKRNRNLKATSPTYTVNLFYHRYISIRILFSLSLYQECQ